MTLGKLVKMETTHAHLFTRREREVIRLRWREGLTYAEISVELEPNVSIRTVGSVLRSIKNKAEMID